MPFKKTKYFRPYRKEGGKLRTALNIPWKGVSGIYFIKRGSKVVYVGSSKGQLKNTIYRHFETWTDRQRKDQRQFDRVTYPKEGGDISIKIVICSPEQAERAEKYFIKKFNPADNSIKYYILTSKQEAEIETTGKEIENNSIPILEDAPF